MEIKFEQFFVLRDSQVTTALWSASFPELLPTDHVWNMTGNRLG